DDGAEHQGPPQEGHSPPAAADVAVPWPRLTIRVLGRVQLLLHDNEDEHDLNGVLTAKLRELLVYLCLHQRGVRRETVNEAVWPDSRPPRPYTPSHNPVPLLRHAISDATDNRTTNVVVNADGRYRLNSDLVSVDVWQLQNALGTRNLVAGTDPACLLQAV